MKIILFGGSGMVGQGVLRECLRADGVSEVLAIGRAPLEARHPRLKQLVQADLFALAPLQAQFDDFDACFFCVGSSVSGADEDAYTRINHDLPLAVAAVLARANPGMAFTYVSGQGTDASERGRTTWARIKGRTENALQQLGFRAVYLFRPGLIFPLHGETSSTRLYRMTYAALGWLSRPLRRLFPNSVLDTEQIGEAMLQVARSGAGNHVLESTDIHRLAMAWRSNDIRREHAR
ncbi:NAD-dependent epimerase/dehydratase family protein [Dyella sp. A6]|uniref:NAD-dependent epimerase/dehydratase family protein n=1 Tax=Dyella aluminiiresistens TaxID=3069105 RepID=UPI002E7746DD|nr:NAD-dependent epimerase/dehydratase family protein [Dyella sp. A6]